MVALLSCERRSVHERCRGVVVVGWVLCVGSGSVGRVLNGVVSASLDEVLVLFHYCRVCVIFPFSQILLHW